MARRLEAVKLAVQHVRKPRDRMPVRRVGLREGPVDALPSQPRLHLRIICQVRRIIESDEARLDHRQIHCHGDQRQQRAA